MSKSRNILLLSIADLTDKECDKWLKILLNEPNECEPVHCNESEQEDLLYYIQCPNCGDTFNLDKDDLIEDKI